MNSQLTRLVVAGVLVMVAMAQTRVAPPEPTPEPAALSLRGLFVGSSAAEDAALLAAFSDELADEIEWDGRQDDPFLKTASSIDELRTRARIIRLQGDSLGDRQPRVRDAVSEYLTEQVGVLGGPVDAEVRAKWVSAYRDIAEASRDALGR